MYGLDSIDVGVLSIDLVLQEYNNTVWKLLRAAATTAQNGLQIDDINPYQISIGS